MCNGNTAQIDVTVTAASRDAKVDPETYSVRGLYGVDWDHVVARCVTIAQQHGAARYVARCAGCQETWGRQVDTARTPAWFEGR